MEPGHGGRARSSGVQCGGAGMGRERQEEGKVCVSWVPLLGVTSSSIPVLLWQRETGPCPDPGK